jgi:beta-galactosidase
MVFHALFSLTNISMKFNVKINPMSKGVRYVFISFLFISFFANTMAQVLSKRQKISLDEDWKFHLGNAANPDSDFNYRTVAIYSKSGKAEKTAIDPKFKDDDWRTVQLPHDWAVELPFTNSKNADILSHGFKPIGGLFPQNGIGWYRKHFSVSRADSGQRYSIQFDGIFRDSKIWVNGYYLGNNESGYLGVSYDITDYLNFDKDNVITVRADATQFEGWFYEGAGIYRHVWLNKFNNTHITDDGIFVHTKVEPGKAIITIETTVKNDGLKAGNYTVSSSIADRNGHIINKTGPKPIFLKVNQEATIEQSITVNNPHLWSTDDPYLYKVIPVIKQANITLDTKTVRFGIRTIVIDAVNGVTLNGKSIKIKGVNCHQDHAGLGSALPDYLQYYRIQALKEMGANAYRTSHNAPTPELLDACDSLGMLVLDEQRLLNSSKEYMGQFERLIKRDRSRASVFMWSIGNEEGHVQANNTGKRIAQTLLAKQIELDPTRISTYAADLGNVFTGINEVIPVRGFNYRQFAVIAYHKDHPLQPIIGTEMGSTVTTRGIYEKDTIKAYLPDEDITAPWWASRAEEWWPIAANNKWFMGGFVWTGFDYRGEPTPYEWPNINSHFGLMDMCGFPKNIYYYYQSWWTDKDVLHISPHWNWKGKEGKPIDVWVNTNAAEAELFLNGKSLGKKTMPRNSHLQWSVPYQPGILSAIAYKNNKKLTAKVETTGEPVRIIITPSKTVMLADHKDAVVINISVADQQGREVPDADNLIRFSIKGNAKIIGVGNGDPSSHEPDKCADNTWQRRLFNGKCQVILQAANTLEQAEFKATTDDFPSASIKIEVTK